MASPEPYSWTREKGSPKESKFVPLDDVLQVKVIERTGIRQAVKDYVGVRYDRPVNIHLASGRGKLIAQLLELSGSNVVFGDLVKMVNRGLQRSEFQPLRELDGRELARILCKPALD